MRIQSLHTGFIMPTKGSDQAGAYDTYMPEPGEARGASQIIGLGFAAEVPADHVALLLPRSGVGAKFGLELNNTCGVIDADYRGEWKVALRTKSGLPYSWNAGDRLIQFLIVPVAKVSFELTESLHETARSTGGFGHTGK